MRVRQFDILILDVDIGAGFDQRLDHLEIAGIDGRRTRSASLRVSRVDVYASSRRPPVEISTPSDSFSAEA